MKTSFVKKYYKRYCIISILFTTSLSSAALPDVEINFRALQNTLPAQVIPTAPLSPEEQTGQQVLPKEHTAPAHHALPKKQAHSSKAKHKKTNPKGAKVSKQAPKSVNKQIPNISEDNILDLTKPPAKEFNIYPTDQQMDHELQNYIQENHIQENKPVAPVAKPTPQKAPAKQNAPAPKKAAPVAPPAMPATMPQGTPPLAPPPYEQTLAPDMPQMPPLPQLPHQPSAIPSAGQTAPVAPASSHPAKGRSPGEGSQVAPPPMPPAAMHKAPSHPVPNQQHAETAKPAKEGFFTEVKDTVIGWIDGSSKKTTAPVPPAKASASQATVPTHGVMPPTPSLPSSGMQHASIPPMPSVAAPQANGPLLTVNFTGNSTDINNSSQALLTDLATRIGKAGPDKMYKIIGYAQGNGSSNSEDRRIALQRVINIQKFLVSHGVNSANLTVQAVGANKNNPANYVQIVPAQ
jgi:outer membrane protein OmpA-like peptidoglycan-associated protein